VTATIDRTYCDHVPLQRVGESLLNPEVTGYRILGIEDLTIRSVTDDEPERRLLFAGLQLLPSFRTHLDPWPIEATSLGIATAISRPLSIASDRALVSAFSRIAEMSNLPQNWDGEDADPPTGRAVATACHLIAVVRSERLERGRQDGAPAISSPLSDGGLQVEWQGSNCRIDVQISDDGSLGFLTKCGSGPTAEYHEADIAPLVQIVELIHRTLDT
jgi:hypothetical protein